MGFIDQQLLKGCKRTQDAKQKSFISNATSRHS